MKLPLRTVVLLFLPACSRCTGENLPPVAEAPPVVAEHPKDAGPGRIFHTPQGDITVKSAATVLPPNPQMRKRTHN